MHDMSHKDIQAAVASLCAWFDSQGIDHCHAVVVMGALTVNIVRLLAHDKNDARIGLEEATLGMRAYLERHP